MTVTMPATEINPPLGYGLVDADAHYYEPHDCFTRHLEPRFRDRAVNVVVSEGLGRLHFGDRQLAYMRVIPTDYTGAPGSLRELYEGDTGDGFVQNTVINAHDHPPFMQREACLELMDAQGVEATLMFPSVTISVEHEIHHDVEATFANLRAFNRWLEEDWGYDDGRIFSVPVLSLLDVDLAVAELERVLALGARMVHVRPGPLYGRSPADPALDPVWRRIEEAGVPVALHSSESGYNEFWSSQWGEAPRPSLRLQSPFQWYLGNAARPIADTLACFVLHNLFGRFPGLRVVSVENGSTWVAPLLAAIDKAAKLGRTGRHLGGPLSGRPSELFREHVYVSPFPEDDPVELADAIGFDRVLLGSDFPHPEGLAEPIEFAEKLRGVAVDDAWRVLRANTAELIGLDLGPAPGGGPA